ncbi:MAG: HAD-IIB family hydrolase [bacterium]|nr:MAG: HAD-IIB family hydrolase [bacterium]
MLSSSVPEKQILIFSDLDGTILSSIDYSPGPSLEAVELGLQNGMEFVIVSSKTRAEIEFLQQEFGWNFSFISENGGAIYIPEGTPLKKISTEFIKQGRYWKLELGVNYAEVCNVLQQIAEKLQLKITAFNQLSDEQVAQLAGLPLQQAKLARIREYDEPFLVAEQNANKIELMIKKIEKRGLRYTRGGRFHHIIGNYDKGQAVYLLKELYRKDYGSITTAAIGDAKNDVPMFNQMDHPFLVRKFNGSYEAEAVIPNITITNGIGPDGFVEAIEVLVNKYTCI